MSRKTTTTMTAVALVALSVILPLQPQQPGTQAPPTAFRVTPVDGLSQLIIPNDFPKWDSGPQPAMGAFVVFVDALGKTTQVHPFPTAPEAELQALESIAKQLEFHPVSYKGTAIPFTSILGICTDPNLGTFPCAPRQNGTGGVDDPIPQRLRFPGCEDRKTWSKCKPFAPITNLKISGANPRYPEDAKYARIEGTVIVHVVVSTAGEVLSLRALGGPSKLRESATEAIKTWKYRPLTWNGTPVEVEFNAVIHYELRG